ncbi:restriction endonuclease subunit S [Tenacibaculum sp. AHE15PA]|uniref:restriction endonuclease subunit S n=1 Tax=unclassified Tenacibaculum TaxID=2635139 RepID=UPI001C4EEA0D|nr:MULTISPECIES: restriction endonuclease subunit S [unclassified Tenacibaculum]QXP74668.1 restriction endonuclease subunit S [Tenacibaculum sp. AHE14PA]QXP76179.1 restriction endonuclease subunit S [Tenacibaculum sp. AHE15PA]
MEKQLIPQLRFPYYNDDWDKVVLEKITTKISDGIHSTPNYDLNGEYYFVNGNNLVNGSISINENTKKVSLEEFKKHKRPLSKNSILLSINGTIGNLAFYNNENIVLGKSACYINLQKDLPINFYYYILQTPKIKKYFLSELTGSTIMNLSLRTIKATKLIVPPLTEQQKIASFLTDVDDKITKLTKKKELLEHYKKGVTKKIFNQELRFKDDEGNEFPVWEEKRLGEIGSIVSGLTYSPNDIDENGVLVLRSSNVKKRLIALNDNVFVNVEEGKFNPVKLNDILICVRNGSKRLIGKNAIIKEEHIGLAFGAFMTVYRSNYNRFLFHFFDSQYYKKEVHKNLGATINSINGGDLKKFKVPFPCIAEQIKIANFLSDIDVKIKALNTKIENSKSFKKGLLQKMFV